MDSFSACWCNARSGKGSYLSRKETWTKLDKKSKEYPVHMYRFSACEVRLSFIVGTIPLKKKPHLTKSYKYMLFVAFWGSHQKNPTTSQSQTHPRGDSCFHGHVEIDEIKLCASLHWELHENQEQKSRKDLKYWFHDSMENFSWTTMPRAWI